MTTEQETKRCPYCGEEILAVAIKCKHCGSNITEDAGPATTVAAVEKAPADFGLFLIAIPIIATMLIWFWIDNLNLLQSPGEKLSLILVSTIVGTAIVAAMEASKANMKTDRLEGTYGPVAWFLIFILLWVVGYPSYMFKRKHYGLKNQVVAALLVGLIFVGSFVLVNSAINSQAAQLRQSLRSLQQ